MISKYNILIALTVLCICIIPVSALTITTNPVSQNSTNDCVTFNGTATGSAGTYHAWFEYGMNNSAVWVKGQKTFKTPNQTRNTDGNFYFKQCGIPLMTGEAYEVQAVGEYIRGENSSWTMPTPTPHATTTYSNYVDSFLEQNEYENDLIDPIKLLTYDIWQPYLGLMGGLFFGVLLGFIMANIVLKQKSVAITVILFMLVGISLMALLPPAMVQIGQMLFIASIAGLLYWIIAKRR